MAIDISKIKKADQNTSKKTGSGERVMDFLKKDIHLFGNELSDAKKEAFYLELEILLAAGVDIKTALELIVKELPKEKDKELFEKIKKDVLSGSSLSTALKNSGRFSAYEFFSIQIGEETGKISAILKELAVYYHNIIKQKRQVISALSYPAIMICTSLGVLFFMLAFVVPMLSEMYKRVGGELPYFTQLIIAFSNFILDYSFLFLLILIATIGLITKYRKTEKFRRVSSFIILKIPLVGELVRKIFLARFCSSMSLLLASKVPILRALSLVKQMIEFYPIESSIGQIEKDILAGSPLNKSMSAFPVYYPRMISLIKVGEEVNRLEFFFSNISSQYTDEVDHQTSMISKLIEPLLLLFIGLVVGTILVAMYLPLIKLGTTIQ